jgi:peptide deformylase
MSRAPIIRPIQTWPDQAALRARSREVTKFDDPQAPEDARSLRALILDMGETMLANQGAGLAAIQVGHLMRLVVLADTEGPKLTVVGDKPERRRGCFALVNPRIVEASEETDVVAEGCLSLPGLQVAVERPTRVLVEHETAFGDTIRLEATGKEARVLQHEIDHLDGKLIIDHLDEVERKQAIRTYVVARMPPVAGGLAMAS